MNKCQYEGFFAEIGNEYVRNPYSFNTEQFWAWEEGFRLGILDLTVDPEDLDTF